MRTSPINSTINDLFRPDGDVQQGAKDGSISRSEAECNALARLQALLAATISHFSNPEPES